MSLCYKNTAVMAKVTTEIRTKMKVNIKDQGKVYRLRQLLKIKVEINIID